MRISKNRKKLFNDLDVNKIYEPLDAIKILKNKLLPEADLITPNIPEAEILAQIKIKTTDDMIIAGKKLLGFGAKNVLIKGGHLKAKYV